MANLLEVEYEKIFSPKTMAALKGKSGESLRQMLGNKDLMQTLMRSKAVLDEIIDTERLGTKKKKYSKYILSKSGTTCVARRANDFTFKLIVSPGNTSSMKHGTR